MNFRAFIGYAYYFKTIRNLNHCGKNLILSKGGVIKRPEQLSIGDNIFINRNFHISAYDMKIGSNVMIGPNFVAECDDHKFNIVGKSMYSISKDKNFSGITIENDVWIGSNVVLLKGVTVGEGSIVGAGSVVCRSILPYTVSVGVPCKPIRTRFSPEDLSFHLKLVDSTKSIEDILKSYQDNNLK
jgi:acetyltransferase-like isoleucine patch superfamily enzyme